MYHWVCTPRKSPTTIKATWPSSPDEARRTAEISSPSEEEKLNAVFDRLPQLLEWKWSPFPTSSSTPTKPSFPSETDPTKITNLPSSTLQSKGKAVAQKLIAAGKEEEEEPKLLPIVVAASRRPRSHLQRTILSNPWSETLIPTPPPASPSEFLPFDGLNCPDTLSDALRSSGVTSDTPSFHPSQEEEEEEEEETDSRSCGSRRRFLRIKQSSSSKKKKKRKKGKKKGGGKGRLPEGSVKILRQWLEENMENPYASYQQKHELALSCRLHYEQVSNWISNARGKLNIRKCTQKR